MVSKRQTAIPESLHVWLKSKSLTRSKCVVPALITLLSQDLLVHGCGLTESNVICLILSGNTLSEAQKSHILLYAKDMVNLQDATVDTQAEGDGYVWRGYHFGVWNRFAWTVSIS